MICAGQSQGGWSHVGRFRSTSRVRGDTLITPDRAFQVHDDWLGGAEIGRFSWEGINTGRHEKALVRCPCSRFAKHHVAPRTRCCCV